MTIDFPPEPAVVACAGGSPVTVHPAPASFTITVPAPAAVTPPAGASDHPAAIQTSSAAPAAPAATGRSDGAGSGFPTIPVAAAVAAAVIIGSALTYRRRRTPGPNIADAGPPVDGDGTGPAPPAAATAGPPANGNGTEPIPSAAPTAAASAPSRPRHDDPIPAGPPLAVPSDQPAPSRPVPDPGMEGQVHPQPAPASAPLLPPPPAPPPLDPETVEVQVLGPFRLVGWPDPSALPGQTALELLAFMALHPGQSYRAEQLRNVIGRGRTTDLDLDTIRRYVRELRRVLGPERVPAARPGGGYRVLGIWTDAGRFEQFLQAPDAAAVPAEQALHLAQALALVRGFPFIDSPEGSFGWVHTDDNVASAAANRIPITALRLAPLAIGAGDTELALWATGTGARVWPTDESLDDPALSAAALDGTFRLDQVWTAIKNRYRAEGVEPSSRSTARYQRLRADAARSAPV